MTAGASVEEPGVLDLPLGARPALMSEEGVGGWTATDMKRDALLALTSSWRDVQQTRMAVVQRGQEDFAALLQPIEDRLSERIKRELRAHPAWPWLAQYPGLGGVHAARLVALIGDPHRFPGAVCDAGHHHAARSGLAMGSNVSLACGVSLADESICPAQVGPVRGGTGTRHLWAYLGLAPVDGHLPRRTRGQQATWNPVGRTICLQPGGLAEQIVRLRVPKYRDIYDEAKARLASERGPEASHASEVLRGPAPLHSQATDESVLDLSTTQPLARLSPIQVEKRARTIAVKAFAGDLLAELKRVG